MRSLIIWFFNACLLGLLLGIVAIVSVFYYYGAGLPDYKTLASYQPPVVSRVYTNDGKVFAEYASENRIYVPNSAIPDHVKKAFIAAEDKNFYDHYGIDLLGIFKAVIKNISRIRRSKRPIGASTITQQVAKNFLLSDIATSVSIEKKIKEAILSFRIERAYSKDYILELYLNEVYLGNRSYGVAAAALNYFNKGLQELTIGEAAFLAVLPKAPSRYHPHKRPGLTYNRRNWVIKRMLINKFITYDEASAAYKESIVLRKRDLHTVIQGNYFAEEVRREVASRWGENALYTNGYVIRTSLDDTLQKIAKTALQNGLIYYDRRHGWRGAVATIKNTNDSSAEDLVAQLRLSEVCNACRALGWDLAVVDQVQDKYLQIILPDSSRGVIALSNLKWARRYIDEDTKGEVITHPGQVAHRGDVLLVKKIVNDKNKQHKKYAGHYSYSLCQIPKVSGGIVVIDQNTGKVLAIQGGFNFKISQFNRATQAKRQTGSSFKPFVYLAALESGLTLSTIIQDSPIAIDMGYGLGIWRPNNWDMKFLGPLTLRRSFELSRNISTVRMIHEAVGMKKVVNVAKRFNIDKSMLPQLSGVLGASETTLLHMVAAYAMIANGGKFIEPSFIDYIQNRRGETVFVNKHQVCDSEQLRAVEVVPTLQDLRPRVTSSASAYQLTSMLVGSVKRGLGRFLKEIKATIAVKSGTSNDCKDAWMVGYSNDLTVGVFVGFDNPKSLGKNHYGSNVAGPIFKEFMRNALKNRPVLPFKVPRDVKLVRVNVNTGRRTEIDDKNAIYEAFKDGSEIMLENDNNSDLNGNENSDAELSIVY